MDFLDESTHVSMAPVPNRLAQLSTDVLSLAIAHHERAIYALEHELPTVLPQEMIAGLLQKFRSDLATLTMELQKRAVQAHC